MNDLRNKIALWVLRVAATHIATGKTKSYLMTLRNQLGDHLYIENEVRAGRDVGDVLAEVQNNRELIARSVLAPTPEEPKADET